VYNIVLFDNIPLFSSSLNASSFFSDMLLRSANLPLWRGELTGGPLLVGATLPEATYFTKNGLSGRVSPECGMVEGGWFSLSFFQAFFLTPLVSEASPLSILESFSDESVGVDYFNSVS